MLGAGDPHRSNRRGIRDLPLPSVEEAESYRYDADEEAIHAARSRDALVGSPERIRDRLLALAEEARADEIMILTHVHAHEARKRSYELLAEAFGVRQPSLP